MIRNVITSVASVAFGVFAVLLVLYLEVGIYSTEEVWTLREAYIKNVLVLAMNLVAIGALSLSIVKFETPIHELKIFEKTPTIMTWGIIAPILIVAGNSFFNENLPPKVVNSQLFAAMIFLTFYAAFFVGRGSDSYHRATGYEIPEDDGKSHTHL